MELINSFKKYLVAIVPEMVFKSVPEAEANETKESRIYGDLYVDAELGTMNFDSIRDGTIPTTILNQIGIFDTDVIKLINENKYNIPQRLRNTVLELYRKEITSNYVERNNYYRMLYGLPNLGSEGIYVSPNELESFGYHNDSQEDYDNDNLSNLTPIHELPHNTLILMESLGYLDELYNDYKDDKNYDSRYIKYLGLKRISPIVSRTASQYELLYVPAINDANRFTKDFTNYYEESRQYFLNQIYNYHFNTEYDFYEGYIGFFILTMAIQRTINSLFEVVIQRDFYDAESCRIFLEAYGVPFIQTFTFNQQLTLVKNLNILLMGKCTTNVLFDLLNILGYKRFSISKYLLVKQHKTEQEDDYSEPTPVFVYKTSLSDDGSLLYELDKSEMYDYYFIMQDVNDTDLTLVEESDPSAYSYPTITEDDVYWIEDSELIEKLREDEINFVETKYASVSITIKMYEVLFEEIYLQKMICDKGSETAKIMVDIPLITSYQVSLLDMEVLLICLLCKYYGMSPDLLVTPSKELSVLGFNFDADLEAIKQDILSNPKIYSKELTNYIINITFNSVSDVNEMYGNAKTLANMLIEGMESTNSPQVYHAYRKLYNALLLTEVHNEVFSLPDGTIPETYMDWLKENNYPLYEYVDELGENEILDKINYITTKYISWFTNCKYLDYLNPMDDNITRGIVKILRWFKSYTIDIKNLDIIYLFDSRYHNLMKLMSRMWFHVNGTLRELNIGYADWVSSISAYVKTSEKLNKLMDAVSITSSMKVKDLDKFLHDKLRDISASITLSEKTLNQYLDYLCDAICHITLKDNGTRQRDSVRIIDPDDIKKSRLVYNADYDSEDETLVLHNIPIMTEYVDEETISIDTPRDIITDENLIIG